MRRTLLPPDDRGSMFFECNGGKLEARQAPSQGFTAIGLVMLAVYGGRVSPFEDDGARPSTTLALVDTGAPSFRPVGIVQ